MTDIPADSASPAAPHAGGETRPSAIASRTALLKRLADVVSLPESRVNAFERSVASDLIVEMLREAEEGDRLRVARRLAPLADIPSMMARLLLRDSFCVAEPLLVHNAHLSDLDLVDCVRRAQSAHRRAIAARKTVSEAVCEALIGSAETEVIESLLHNPGARLSGVLVDALVAMSRENRTLTAPLLRRPEVRPSHAYVLFWWADAAARRVILQRFAVSREVLQDAASDVFAMAAAEGWSDALSRKALQFIERRQRNRAAIERSPFENLEQAVAAAEQGFTAELIKEIAYLSGIKPMSMAKILGDRGGEPLAVLCKATGLPRTALASLWRSLGRSLVESDGRPAAGWEWLATTFDMIAVDRAQTVLRYWNWALSSAISPELLEAVRAGDLAGLDEFSAPARAAVLALAPQAAA